MNHRWIAAPASLVLAAGTASAHVDYVADDGGDVDLSRFVLDLLTPVNVFLLLLGIVTAFGAVGVYHWTRPFGRDVEVLRETLQGYRDLVPWMLRLSLGLPLVGAGFAGYFYSPEVATSIRVFQVGVGFLLLLGLATRVMASLGLAAYVGGLVVHPELLLASEYVGGFLALMAVGSGRPSADHMLHNVADAPDTFYGRVDPVHHAANWVNTRMSHFRAYAPVFVRAGLGFNLAFLGLYEKLLSPGRALAVVEKYGLSMVPLDPGMWVLGAGLTEMGLGAALLLGFYTRAAAATAFMVLTLTLFALPDDPVLAHVTLFGLCSVLFVTGGGPMSLDSWIARSRG